MRILNIVFGAVILGGLTLIGAYCVVRPRLLVEWMQEKARTMPSLGLNPFLFKSGYPTFLRLMGLSLLGFVVLCILVATGHSF